MLPCDWCKKSGHSWFQCPDPKRPAEWRPERLARAKPNLSDQRLPDGHSRAATAASRVGVASGPDRAQVGRDALAAATVAAITKRPRGRPKSIEDMSAYKAAKQKEYRKRRAAAKPKQEER